MDSIKTAWQLLWSLPTAIAFVVLAVCVYVGFGDKQLDRFIRGWNESVS